MIYSSPKSYDVPALDLLSFLFGEYLMSGRYHVLKVKDNPSCQAKEETIIHLDAKNPSNSITKSLGRELTKSIAYSLRHSFGIGENGPGKDVVICISSGQLLLPMLFYGVIAAGGVYSAASASFTASELERQIKQGNSNLVFCSEDAKDVAVKAAGSCGVPLSRVCVIKSSPEWTMRSLENDVSVLPSKGKLDWKRITDQEELENSLICLLYSSGTTGIPKGSLSQAVNLEDAEFVMTNPELLGVILSHTNIVAESFIPSTMFTDEVARRVERGEPAFEYRTLAHLPASHIAGVQGYFINPFYMGGPVYWMPKFDFAKFLEYNKKFRITFFFTVPPIYLLIAKMPIVTDQFDHLEVAISGAAPLGKELQHAASRKLGRGKTFIAQTWGLSETTGSVTAMPWGEKDDTGSVSKLLPNMSVR